MIIARCPVCGDENERPEYVVSTCLSCGSQLRVTPPNEEDEEPTVSVEDFEDDVWEEDSFDDEDIRRIQQVVRAVLNADQSVTGEIADRWLGGQLVLKPGRAGMQEKTLPIEMFFRKITSVRDRLRVLEQRINSHPKLDDVDRLQLQEYITKAYGSLTSFNVLFTDPADRFVGTGGKDD